MLAHRASSPRTTRARSRAASTACWRRSRAGDVHVLARARRHPHERREPAQGADRPGRPGGCTPRARATTRWRPTSGSRCATAIDCARCARSRGLQLALARKAEAHADTVMPGFTHLQPAQPVTFGHHLLAYVEMFGRDRGRFADARARMNECPLGAAALAGTSFPIDRHADRRGARLRPARPPIRSTRCPTATSRWRRWPRPPSPPCICRGWPRRS